MKAKREKKPFVVADALARAEQILAAPPAGGRKRPRGKGQLVMRFVLPLDLAAPINRTMHGQAWRLGKLKRDVATLMALQHGPRRAPLPGRPIVRCIRFSSAEPDRTSAWSKLPVDVLCAPGKRAPNRLSFIVDDRPSCAEVIEHWERVPPGQGFACVEVWTG